MLLLFLLKRLREEDLCLWADMRLGLSTCAVEFCARVDCGKPFLLWIGGLAFF